MLLDLKKAEEEFKNANKKMEAIDASRYND
jgi:hypothetical protein